jgi:hypothetical protein
LTAAALLRWGDIFDLLSYAVFAAVLLWQRRALRGIEVWLLAGAGHLLLLISADRVTGYPDGDIAGHLAPIVWAALDLGAIVLALRRRIRPLVAVLVVGLVHLPVLELPGFALRQIGARALTEAAPPQAEAELLFYSKVKRDRVYAVGAAKRVQPEMQHVAMVFERQREGRYILASEIWFVGEGGTMDRQRPALSRVLLWPIAHRRSR